MKEEAKDAAAGAGVEKRTLSTEICKSLPLKW
jgi:hypothetical protein